MDKDLMVLKGEIKTPPMSEEARREVGYLIRLLQSGELLSMPLSRPMPSIGARCHELRVNDRTKTCRVIYRIDPDAILVVDIFAKTTRETPRQVIDECKRRLKLYDQITGE
jgi:phage-related protein